jgi:hypothetical protein
MHHALLTPRRLYVLCHQWLAAPHFANNLLSYRTLRLPNVSLLNGVMPLGKPDPNTPVASGWLQSVGDSPPMVYCVVDVWNYGSVPLYNVTFLGANFTEANFTESNTTTLTNATTSLAQFHTPGSICRVDVLPRNTATPPCILACPISTSDLYEGYAEIRAEVTAATKWSQWIQLWPMYGVSGNGTMSFWGYQHVSLPYQVPGEPELRLTPVLTAPGTVLTFLRSFACMRAGFLKKLERWLVMCMIENNAFVVKPLLHCVSAATCWLCMPVNLPPT